MSIIHLFLFNLLLLTSSLSLSSDQDLQGKPRLCIMYDHQTDHIFVEVGPDSTSAEFTINKTGFETEEKREQAIDEYFNNKRSYFPAFQVFYYSVSEPKYVQFLNDVDCSEIVSVNKFRYEELYSQWVYFIEKKSKQEYIVWRSTLEPEE